MTLKNKKIAIVHDWLTVYGGAERVLEQILACYPDADVFTLVDFLPESERGFLHNKIINTSFIQRLWFARKKYRSYLPLMPLAIEQFDLSSYDLIISSSYAVAKGVITGPDQVHISYVHSPIRYAWDMQFQYLQETGMNKGIKSAVARIILHYIRLWDVRTAYGVDAFIANSNFIKRRIGKIYRREADVIYPPVDVNSFVMCEKKENFYVTASRMVPYKRIPMIVDAFSRMPDKRLVVIGDGPEFNKCKSLAAPNIEFLGGQPFDVLSDYLCRAKAFVFAAEEDFGIAPVDAQACGTPVIAFGKGGALETVRGIDMHSQPTGLFYYAQTADELCNAIKKFESCSNMITAEACRANAERFSSEIFRQQFVSYVESTYFKFHSQGGIHDVTL
jgi:glycosyltransferase involved in cell wall biosynthesis